jgi:hypothetical protein
MELAYSKENEAFRKEVRTWLKHNLPKKDKSISDLMPHDPERVTKLTASLFSKKGQTEISFVSRGRGGKRMSEARSP